MRVCAWAVALVVLASTLGWLLLRGEGDAGGDRAVAPSQRAARDVARSRDAKAAQAPRAAGVEARTRDATAAAAPDPADLSSDAEAEAERAASFEVASAESVRRPARARLAPAIEGGRQPGRFNGRALEEVGYRPHEVEKIRRRWEEVEAEVRALREQLEDTPGVTGGAPRSEQHEFDSEMREILGDDDYDAGRFATGRDNRVEIRQIPEDSIAVVVGLQEGDLLIAYDGTPIYTSDEYLERRRIDRADGPSEFVLTIERAGKTYEFVVPEGEMWALFRDVRIPPL